MVINLHRKRRTRANIHGDVWPVGSYRRDIDGARRYRCFLNGVDVTNRTFYCDSRRGIVRMFKHNAEGRPYVDMETHEAAVEEKRGHVRLRRRAVA